MATTPEGKVKSKIKKLLNKYGAYSHMPVQNGMGAPSLDYVACYKGLFLGIEAKAPGKKPTDRQVRTMSQMRNAGGYVFVIDGDESLMQLEKFLIQVGKVIDRQKQVEQQMASTPPTRPSVNEVTVVDMKDGFLS